MAGMSADELMTRLQALENSYSAMTSFDDFSLDIVTQRVQKVQAVAQTAHDTLLLLRNKVKNDYVFDALKAKIEKVFDEFAIDFSHEYFDKTANETRVIKIKENAKTQAQALKAKIASLQGDVVQVRDLSRSEYERVRVLTQEQMKALEGVQDLPQNEVNPILDLTQTTNESVKATARGKLHKKGKKFLSVLDEYSMLINEAITQTIHKDIDTINELMKVLEVIKKHISTLEYWSLRAS